MRLRSYPRCRGLGSVAPALILLLSVVAALGRNWLLFLILSGIAIALAVRGLQECAGATAEVLQAVDKRSPSVRQPQELEQPTRKLEQPTTIRS